MDKKLIILIFIFLIVTTKTFYAGQNFAKKIDDYHGQSDNVAPTAKVWHWIKTDPHQRPLWVFSPLFYFVKIG